MKKYVFVRHEGCPLCKKLKEGGIPEGFVVIDEAENPVDFMSLVAFYEIRTLPAIVVSEETVTEENKKKIKKEVWRIRLQGKEAVAYAEKLRKGKEDGNKL